MIETKELTFAYEKNEILKNVSFLAKEGEITYLAGANGAGKTTWIKCAVSLLRAQNGAILFDGKKFEDIKNDFSICFDTPPIYRNLSAYDNLFVLYNVECKSKEALNLLKKLGITEYMLKERAGKLSFGQRHRLGVAGALLRKPKYLILDEPDLGVDPIAWEIIKEHFRELKDKGTTIILTGQNINQLEDIVDHVTLLLHGEIIEDISINKFLDKYCANKSLREAFLNVVR